MKLLILILLSVSFLNCKVAVKGKINSDAELKIKENPQEADKPHLELGDFMLFIRADSDDFHISKAKNDTIRIKKILYKSLDGGVLKPKEDIIILDISETLFFDVKQYTIDDNPATPLGLNIEKEIYKQEIDSYEFESVKTYKNWLLDTHFGEIKTKSISYQNDFFQNLRQDKTKYQECCQEYLVQADTFLNSDIDDFLDFEGLNVEPYIKQRIVRINYTNDGVALKKTIIYN